jgi:hypothetical protein
MASEETYISRIEKAIDNGGFPPIQGGDFGSVLFIHQESCVNEDNGDRSNCNCIPNLIVSFKGQTFTIDKEGMVSNQVIN